MLRRLLIALFLASLFALAAPVLLIYQGLQSRPLVEATASARQEDIERIKALLRANDPRTLRHGEVRTLTVSERDLNIALRSLLPLRDRQRARVALEVGRGTVHYTLETPGNPVGEYLNLSLSLRENGGALEPERLGGGAFSIPGWALKPLVTVLEYLLEQRIAEYREAREAIESVSLQGGEVAVTYRWDADLMAQIEARGRQAFLPPADRERALAYYRELAALSRQVGGSESLSRLLGTLFQLAVRRSGEGDAAAENRALFLVVGTVLNRSSIHRLVGGDAADLGPGHYYVHWTLAGRNDLARHFGISAAIAVAGGNVLADAIGAYKELDDSRGGSGFSFVDLLADRAGVELAVAATGSGADDVQRGMARDGLVESDFMPRLADLPEGLMELEFRQRYSDLDDARYGYVKREIDTRIAALPLHRQ